MKTSRTQFIVVVLILLAPLPVRGADDTDGLRRKQEAQQRARVMTRELVGSILDVQLQQLEENGLKELPMYREIASMKKNLGALVDKEMEKVVELLARAQQAPAAEREPIVRQARQMIREIVMRLSIERQNLLRRLKNAELAAQVRRLIDVQTKVWKETKAIPDQTQAQQEKSALAAIEDQRDAKQLFLQLVETLADVSKWGGTIGTGASEGLRILAAAQVGKELDSAGSNLETTKYLAAAKNQQLVIKGLRLLLEKLEETQGLLNADRQAALALVHELIEKQEKLRDQTKQADLSQPDAEKLVEKQAEIRKDLNKLTQALDSTTAAQDLLEQAKASAYDATGKLFDAKKDDAVAEQGKVLGNLAEIAEQLAGAFDSERPDKSAAEYAKMIADLQKAKAEIDKVKPRQDEASRDAKDNPAAAKTNEEQVAAEVAKIDDQKDLPRSVEARLAAAEQAAKDAAKALEDAGKSKETKQQAVESADRAVERAASEIQAALDDAKRRAEAVKIGELARAAETLERAAAVEREIAQAAKEAAGAKGLEAPEAKALKKEQAEIGQIAAKVAEGVKALAPEAAKTLDEAKKSSAAAEQQLAKAEQKPGELSKPAANEAGKQAASAAETLAKAATELRKQVGEAAKSLAAESNKQLQKITPAREAVENALAKPEDQLARRAADLEQAQKKIREAQTEQERAAGRPQAADAMKLADQIAEAAARQSDADQAAQRLNEGKAASPLEAITKQQQVAEQASKLSEAASKRPEGQKAKAQAKADPVAESLQKAARAAAQAAKAALDGNKSQAETARAETREALKQAGKMAEEEAQAAAQTAAGQPDPAAQKKVTEAAGEAEQLTSAEAPQAGESLKQAGKSSDDAADQLKSGSADKAAEAQRRTAANLKKAAEQVKSEMQKLAGEQAKQLAEQSKQSGQLADRAAPVDPAALSALRDAESKAAQASGQTPNNPENGSKAQAQSRKDTERAAANLNAREQRVQRDKAVAEAILAMAKEQQTAADEIASQREALLDLASRDAAKSDSSASAKADAAKGKSAPNKNQRKQAAQKLGQAQNRFAQAQRATGQGAEEVSGQSEVVNPPLREAMELASGLNPADFAAEGMEEAESGEAGEAPNADASAAGEKTPLKTANSGKAGSKKVQGKPAGKKAGAKGAPSKSGQLSEGTPAEGSEAGEPQLADESLGTGFVPNSPEKTAEMIAGPEALAEAAELLGMELAASGAEATAQGKSGKGKPGDQQDESSQADGEAPEGAEASQDKQGKTSTSGKGGSTKGGDPRKNQGVKDGPLDVTAEQQNSGDSKTATEARDADAASRKFQEEPWFAKLPPELRKAIQAKSQRRPPRGYEERLQRYFESID